MSVHPTFIARYSDAGYYDLVQRFWSKVNIGSYDACWPWMSATSETRGGLYGRFTIKRDGKRITAYAHRIAYEMTFGLIPDGEGYHGTIVMHSCDNSLCCNPLHMRLGTQKDNVGDMYAKGRQNRPIGAATGRAKINEDDARAIYVDPRPYAEIAADYGISDKNVWCIKSGRTWRHATERIAV